jgi:hypothetical protein
MFALRDQVVSTVRERDVTNDRHNPRIERSRHMGSHSLPLLEDRTDLTERLCVLFGVQPADALDESVGLDRRIGSHAEVRVRGRQGPSAEELAERIVTGSPDEQSRVLRDLLLDEEIVADLLRDDDCL